MSHIISKKEVINIIKKVIINKLKEKEKNRGVGIIGKRLMLKEAKYDRILTKLGGKRSLKKFKYMVILEINNTIREVYLTTTREEADGITYKLLGLRPKLDFVIDNDIIRIFENGKEIGFFDIEELIKKVVKNA